MNPPSLKKELWKPELEANSQRPIGKHTGVIQGTCGCKYVLVFIDTLQRGNSQHSGKEDSRRHHTQVQTAHLAWVGQWTSIHLLGNLILNTCLGDQLETSLYIQTPELRTGREHESGPEGGLDQINP